MDKFSESDPFVVVSQKGKLNNSFNCFLEKDEWKVIHTTETLQNQKNPQWPNPVVIDYKFEEHQLLRFDIYDRDTKSDNLEEQQFIGRYEKSVGKVLNAYGCKIVGKLLNLNGDELKKGKVKFGLTGQQNHIAKDVVQFKFSAKKLQKKNLMGLIKSDPFYRISQTQKSGVCLPIFESEHKNKTSNPDWEEQKVPLQKICNGNYKKKLRIEVHDWEGNGKHKFIGAFLTTMEEMLEKKSFSLFNVKSKKKSCGEFIIEHIEVERKAAFLEYIQKGGCEIKLSVAIDFSMKNGEFGNNDCLHYVSKGTKTSFNEYQNAIVSVAQILQDYDTDQQISCFGFGAKTSEEFETNCFPLSLNKDQIELPGVPGILEAYKNCMDNVSEQDKNAELAPIINKILEDEVEQVTQENQSYAVLLILTAGVISDLEETVKAIVKGSSEALSVIIVGVGESDFSQMEVLDGDNSKHLATEDGDVAVRDIVQFVPYRKVSEKGYSALAEETLQELPEQVEQFFWAKGIVPKDMPKDVQE